MSKGVAIVSGGLDSTTLIHHLLVEGHELRLLSFDYGQRHKKELRYAAMTAQRLGLKHDVIDLTGITHLISNSALTSGPEPKFYDVADDIDRIVADGKPEHGIPVPEGHYAEENMKLTVVPNRNMIMLSIAAGVAVNEKANFLAAAVHAGDHFVYPDCRPDFIDAASKAIIAGNEGFNDWYVPKVGNFALNTPFLYWSKADIAYRALELSVPLHLTWSCYKGESVHCGRCGTCVERLEAIAAAQQRAMETELNGGRLIEDKTEYADTEFWKIATRGGK